MDKILLTGADGQLGLAVLSEYGDTVQFVKTDLTSHGDVRALDIADNAAVLKLVMDEKPDIIINCAALTDVDGCEKQVDLAYQVNALGPRNLAIAASEVGAKFVHISTDYVFSGTDSYPISEFETPAPISTYGLTKYEGEKMVKTFADRWFILRTAWMYGEGKNFVRTMLKLSETRDEISVVDDQIGSPTSAKALAKVIRQLVNTSEYGIYHATCEGSVSWADFAEKIFELAGKSTKVIKVSSKEYKELNPDSADRPPFSRLDNHMMRLIGIDPMPDWEDAIEDYLKDESR